MIPRPTRGPGRRGDAHAADLLLECHERIRRFAGLARALATWPDPTPQDVSAAAARVLRYFEQALPLHVRDEEESVRPRLLAAASSIPFDGLAAALEVMAREHDEHEPLLASLLPRWRALVDDPARLAALREDLARDAAALEEQFERHLALEERLVIPAVRALPPAEAASIVAELRARRAPIT